MSFYFSCKDRNDPPNARVPLFIMNTSCAFFFALFVSGKDEILVLLQCAILV